MKLVAKRVIKKKNETKVEIHLYPDVFKWKKESKSDDSDSYLNYYCDNNFFHLIFHLISSSSVSNIHLFSLISYLRSY